MPHFFEFLVLLLTSHDFSSILLSFFNLFMTFTPVYLFVHFLIYHMLKFSLNNFEPQIDYYGNRCTSRFLGLYECYDLFTDNCPEINHIWFNWYLSLIKVTVRMCLVPAQWLHFLLRPCMLYDLVLTFPEHVLCFLNFLLLNQWVFDF